MICTFYSYKGGVGRSMALANVAELLCRRGLDVRIVDFDLEAPGLERYFDVPAAATRLKDVIAHRGMLDMLNSYRHLSDLARVTGDPAHASAGDGTTSAIDRLTVEPLPNFLVPIYTRTSDGDAGDDRRARKGSLSLVPAGRRDAPYFKEYARRVLTFDWDEFFVNFQGELFFEWFRVHIAKDVDVVLIDSRTGVTEMSGVCTYHLADVVVSFVAANHQNMDGLVQMATNLANRELITEARNGRELFQLFVPSRVANDDESKVEEFRKRFDTQLGPFFAEALRFDSKTFIDLKLPYVPTFAYEERVAGREELKATEADLLRAYEALAERMARLAPRTSRYYGTYVSRSEQRSHAAEDLFAALDESERRLLRQLLTRLVRVGPRGERPVAAQVKLSRTDAERLNPIIARTARAELVAPRTAEHGAVHLTSDVESLIEGWPTLQRWLEEDRAFLIWRQRLCDALADWEADPTPDNVLTGAMLQEARTWLPARKDDLTPSELEFIMVSERSASTSPGAPAEQPSKADEMLRYAWGEYRAWAATSRSLKRRAGRYGLLVLGLMLIGTALGTLSPHIPAGWGEAAKLAPWVAAAALGLATYFTNQVLSESERQAWVKARAQAEGLKSECYKYVTGAPPYEGTNPARMLGERVGELQRIMSGVLAESLPSDERGADIPASRWSLSDYVEKRVRNQVDFYRRSIDRHRAAVSRARMLALGFGIGAVVLSTLGDRGGGVPAALLGTATTAAAAIAAWFQSGHHQQLALSYQGAVSRLELLLAQHRTSDDPSTQLVVDAEAVFQAEHAAWLSEWQGAVTSSQPAAPADSAAPPAPVTVAQVG